MKRLVHNPPSLPLILSTKYNFFNNPNLIYRWPTSWITSFHNTYPNQRIIKMKNMGNEPDIYNIYLWYNSGKISSSAPTGGIFLCSIMLDFSCVYDSSSVKKRSFFDRWKRNMMEIFPYFISHSRYNIVLIVGCLDVLILL